MVFNVCQPLVQRCDGNNTLFQSIRVYILEKNNFMENSFSLAKLDQGHHGISVFGGVYCVFWGVYLVFGGVYLVFGGVYLVFGCVYLVPGDVYLVFGAVYLVL